MPPERQSGPVPSGVTSTLWTVFLGIALVRLVTARRPDAVPEGNADPNPHLGQGARSYSGRPARWVADAWLIASIGSRCTFVRWL